MRVPLILTVTGRRINPLDVRPEDVCEEDIAHHLAHIIRFNGATRRPITVAQHAVYVSRLLDGTGFEWIGLHHDDAEAYVGDVTKWLKDSPAMASFREAEDRAQRSCYTAFGVPLQFFDGNQMPPEVIEADKLMVRFEGLQGYGVNHWGAWSKEVTRYSMVTAEEVKRIGKWTPWSSGQSREAWLTRARTLRLEGRDRPGKGLPVG